MSSRNRYKKFERALLLGKKCCPLKLLSNFILVHFSNFSATKANWKEPRPPKIFVDAEVSF